MGATEDFKELYNDIDWWLLTNCTNWSVNPASVDWSETKFLMYECHQFQDLLDYLMKQQGWTPTLLMERSYSMDITFNSSNQVLEVRSYVLDNPQKVRVHFDTEFGGVYLSYYSNTYQRDTNWHINFDY